MADNTLQTGSANIAADDIGGVFYQRIKPTYGDDGAATDVSLTNPLPVDTPNTYATGTITAANANLTTGTATANSAVQITVADGHTAWDVYVSGTFSAATQLHFQGSQDGTTWWSMNGRRNSTGLANETTQTLESDPLGTNNNPSNWRGNLAGVRFFRVTCGPYTAADSITVSIATSAGTGATFLNAGLPTSTANIGALYPTPAYPIGTTTGTTVTVSGFIGRTIRANANVAQATAATLITAPAATTRIYVTNITCANEGATLTVVRLFAGTLPAAAGAVAYINDCFDFPIAASGGGATVNFPPNAPWALPVATALSFAVTAATTWDLSVTYYVSA